MRDRAPAIGLLLLSVAASAQTPPPQSGQGGDGISYTYKRSYTPGEVDRYELRVRDWGSDSELVGVTEHRVFLQDGVPFERIRWLRLTESRVGDLSSMALEVPSYEISLHPDGNLSLIEVKGDPIMLEMVTDLYAFYFAVSEDAGIGNLHQVSDTHVRAELSQNSWADGDEFLVGESRSEIHLALVSAGEEEVVYQTDFLPPATSQLDMHRSWMESPVCGETPNNAQFVRRQQNGYLAAWGCEKTQITSRVDPESGKIQAGLMDNELVWNIKLCRDPQLTDCEDRPQLTRRRLIELRLSPPPEDKMSGDIRVNPKDGLEYVRIPPGTFEMGCVRGDDECYPEEKPLHAVTLTREFWMSRTEVPVQSYETFAAATDREMPEEPGQGAMPGYNDGWRKKNHPMVKVTWEEAAAFCDWAGGRLPTEAEWEYAARGGVDGLKYPWGNDRTHDQANFWRAGGKDAWLYTAPVASFPANRFGLYDMAGNVYEWVSDWYSDDYYKRSPQNDPHGPRQGRLRVARGGAGFINPAVLRASARLRNKPDRRNIGVGIRCVREQMPQ